MSTIGQIARATRRNLFGVSGIVDDLRAQWDQAIRDFQSQRVALDAAETALYQVRESLTDEADLAEYERLLSQVIARKSAMDTIAGAVTQVSDWFQTAKGYIPGMSGMRRGMLGSLGLGPAFPVTIGVMLAMIGAASAITASVASFITYVFAKRDRLSQVQDYVPARTEALIAAGMEPQAAAAQAYNEANEQATAQAKDDSQHNFGLSMERVAMWTAVAVVAAFVAPKLLERWK